MQVPSLVQGNCLCWSCQAEKKGRRRDGKGSDANVRSIECHEIILECRVVNGSKIVKGKERLGKGPIFLNAIDVVLGRISIIIKKTNATTIIFEII